MVEVALAAFTGLIMGWGVGSSHPAVSAGWWINLPAGALGGAAGSALWADAATEWLAGSEWAGIAAAGAAGGAALVVVAAVVRHLAVRRGR